MVREMYKFGMNDDRLYERSIKWYERWKLIFLCNLFCSVLYE